MKIKGFVLCLMLSAVSFAQNASEAKLPYYEVPEYAESFTAGTMAARMVDALGFRFYWASEGLTEKDLEYKPGDESRTTAETITHILDLSYIIVNSTLKQANKKNDSSKMTYAEQRKQALINLKTAADILRASDDISQYKIIFGTNEIPFWNQVNGPIADAIWHCGQIATFRRISGNPINSNVNHFRGTVKQ
ncbi:hypothetical protein [Psychroserpens sp. SPM9]|uniref:hypothetical protein n=1 Tax=Psychroserpens sp. SPM9 TaxID=2975598 RepID=UPI0021A8E218|nr:hypothetical protein [Psychroserpens sp. SPM9]MDG5492396.1 hypothetical protein [Psychroserpens sp. SPM9]